MSKSLFLAVCIIGWLVLENSSERLYDRFNDPTTPNEDHLIIFKE